MTANAIITNPFPGLRPFREDESYLFFGREKQIDELLNTLQSTRLLAIVGASGSGKSSLVKCGLIPSLHSGFIAEAGSEWEIALFHPGNAPYQNMANALSNILNIIGFPKIFLSVFPGSLVEDMRAWIIIPTFLFLSKILFLII